MAAKYEDNGLDRKKPVKIGGLRGVMIALYNSEEGTILGRTPGSWGKPSLCT